MMHTAGRARALVQRGAQAARRRATAGGALQSRSAAASAHAPALSLALTSSSTLGSALSVAAPSLARSFAAAASSSSADSAAPGADDEGRRSAPAGEQSQGPSSSSNDSKAAGEHVNFGGSFAHFSSTDPTSPSFDPSARRDPRILDVDPYPAEKLAALEQKYSWIDWNDMAKHMHMSDVHFFDQEVPYVDQDFTIRPDFRLLHRLEGANRLKRLQEHEDSKIFRLLTFGYWVTQGRNVRVASEGKIQSLWTLVIAGDQNGTASFGFGKGEDLVIAEKRALQDLRRNLMFVPLFESRTLSHEIMGKHGVCHVRMWPRPRERGMTAGMIPRMIFECFGISDVTAAIHGRALPHHQVMAVFNGLKQVKSLREEALRRGVTAHRMFERGLMQPRHPGRDALHRRGEEVTELLREVKAMQTQDMLMDSYGVNDMLGKKPLFEYPDLLSSPIHDPKPDNVWNESTLGYIQRKPRPLDVGAHNPAPVYPKNRRPAYRQQLYSSRGLPHPKTPQTIKTNRVL